MPRAEGDRSGAGGDDFEAFAVDRFGEDGGGRGAVAGDVAGLGGGFLRRAGRRRFSNLSSSSMSWATVTPSLVTLGSPIPCPERRSARGAQRRGDGPGQLGNAFQKLLASVFVKTRQFRHGCSSNIRRQGIQRQLSGAIQRTGRCVSGIGAGPSVKEHRHLSAKLACVGANAIAMPQNTQARNTLSQ